MFDTWKVDQIVGTLGGLSRQEREAIAIGLLKFSLREMEPGNVLRIDEETTDGPLHLAIAENESAEVLNAALDHMFARTPTNESEFVIDERPALSRRIVACFNRR